MRRKGLVVAFIDEAGNEVGKFIPLAENCTAFAARATAMGIADKGCEGIPAEKITLVRVKGFTGSFG